MSPSPEITRELLEITARLHALIDQFSEGLNGVSTQAKALHERATEEVTDGDE